MENEQNETYIVLEGFGEVNRYRYLYFGVMFTAYILILCSNSTIVCLIMIHKTLHEPMYIFIAALLINSLLYSTVVYPKLLTDILSDKQLISYPVCLLQWFSYYSMTASEILLLSAMAFDRYVSICKPLQYPIIMTKKHINIFLVVAWLLPACETSIPVALNANKRLCKWTLKGVICSSTVYKLHCFRSVLLNAYGLLVLVSNGLFCLLLILCSYIKIYTIVHQSSKKVRMKAAQTCIPHLAVLVSTTCLATFDVLLPRVGTEFSTTVRFVMTIQKILYHPLLNPLIYGLKMKEISKHVHKLFHLRRIVRSGNSCTCLTVFVFCCNKPQV